MTCAGRLILLTLSVIASGCIITTPGEPVEEELLLEITLLGVREGDQVSPGARLAYAVQASGYEKISVTAVIEGAETETHSLGASLTGNWRIDGAFLRRDGKSRIHLQAVGTPPSSRASAGSALAESQGVFVEVHPRLNSIELLSPPAGATIALGEAVQFRITGTDLWTSFSVTVMEETGSGQLTRVDSFLVSGGSQNLSVQETWTIMGELTKRLGTHPLRLVAAYGDQKVQSEPFAIEVSYVLDDIDLLVRSPTGDLQQAGTGALELPKVGELVIRARGRGLSGRTLELSEGSTKLAAVTATGDQVDLAYKPKWEDFQVGNQKRSYHFKVTIGLFEETTGVTVLRWGIIACEWRRADGTAYGDDEQVASGTEVHLTIDVWGFKSSTATLEIQEDDLAGDDHVETLQTPVTSDRIDIPWKAHYVDDSKWTPWGDVQTDAEFYFTAWIEDLSCESKLIEVPAL